MKFQTVQKKFKNYFIDSLFFSLKIARSFVGDQDYGTEGVVRSRKWNLTHHQ